MKIDRRLAIIETSVNASDDVRHIIGRYYDELSEKERAAYCHYRYNTTDTKGIEDVELCVNGTLHFLCERKPKPPTEAEHRRNVEEIERWVLEKQEEHKRCADGQLHNEI